MHVNVIVKAYDRTDKGGIKSAETKTRGSRRGVCDGERETFKAEERKDKSMSASRFEDRFTGKPLVSTCEMGKCVSVAHL